MVTIGVIGAGKLAPRMIRTLLDDQHDARKGKIDLLLPLSKKHFTDEVDVIIDWAEKNDVAYTVVVDPTSNDDEVDELNAAEIIETGKGQVPATIADTVAEKKGLLYVLWDDNDDDGYAAFEQAYEAGVECYDLVNGLERLTFEDDDEPAPADEQEPEEETAPDAPAKPEGEGVNTRAEMMRMKVGPLKEMMAERKITLNRSGKGRITKGAYVDSILIHDETGQTEFMQEGDTAIPVNDGYDAEAEEYADPEAEAVAEMVDTEEAEIPAEEASEKIETFTVEGEYGVTAGTTSSSTSSGIQNHLITYSTPVAATVTPRAMLTGNCAGCGGPIFSLDEADAWPDVKWHHADKCSLS